MAQLLQDKGSLINVWTKTLENSGWNVQVNSSNRMNMASNVFPDFTAFSSSEKIMGLVPSEKDLQEFEKLADRISQLRKESGYKLHILVQSNLVEFIARKLVEFPNAGEQVDSIWELSL
ncbi:hypothetical protein [Nitrososphaera sp.]|uniref:hypothetical protein n=1 Tax=Nitrososphaera sp. TaxID=1971748 RepID=UPI003171DE53